MILLLGGSGFVGTEFRKQLEYSSVDYLNVERSRLDYTQRDSLFKLLEDVRPTFLINCAGYTGKPNVDACELHKGECLHGNAVLPAIIREACERVNLPWGHVSSGCIYSGTRKDNSGFTELDSPNFCFRTNNSSFYSGTKALGEECLAGSSTTYVWRLRIPFNEVDSDRNYLSKVMRYKCLLDATNSVSHLEEFVKACLATWKLRIPFGIYNVTNTGAITTRDVVGLIRQHRKVEKQFQFFESEEAFMKVAAKTPRSNCVLDNTKLTESGVAMSNVVEAIERSLKAWKTR
jgi:dTDP-4-dehydrorhamnose reductase